MILLGGLGSSDGGLVLRNMNTPEDVAVANGGMRKS
jgi:hypothetical protein